MSTVTSVRSRREEIIQLAAELFDRSGYAQASMRDIAQAAGIAKPTLYHYFASKDEILHGIHEEFIELLLQRQQQRIDSGASPQQRLRGAMGDILELMRTHRGHVRVFFEHHRELSPQQQRASRLKRDRYEQLIEQAFRDGIAEGSLRVPDAKLAALALFGISNWAYQWYRDGGPLSTQQLADAFWSMLSEGIVAR